MAPDTQQNLLYTIYFILVHNAPALIYGFGLFMTSILILIKPSRAKFLILWGFIILFFAFEYNKHILEPLKEQTVKSLITERQSYRIERYVNVTISKLVPLGLPMAGWGLIIGGIVMKFTNIEAKIDRRLEVFKPKHLLK